MEEYIKKYEQFDKKIVYDFNLGSGGIGDCIKFFMHILRLCINNNTRLYYKKNNIEIEKYIKLKYEMMYIDDDNIKKLDNVTIVLPQDYYSTIDYNFNINIEDVFYFTDDVKLNRTKLISSDITNYISIHLRLGDKYLETDEKYVMCKTDVRNFSEETIYKFIEDNYNKHIIFFCDNNKYKLKIKEKYNNIIITNCNIGHTSLLNTTQKEVLDAITEFYLLTNSELIFSSSFSGFSIVASKFKNIQLLR